MATTSRRPPHDFEGGNVLRIPVARNPQKRRKPHPDPSKRAATYWDLRGRRQSEYDARLDALPDEGAAPTAAGEIFRAATKLYYDFHNNAMVNNTSGAINYLATQGVLDSEGRGETECGDGDGLFDAIHPYAVGARIHFGEPDLRRTIERLMDRTIDHLRARPELETTPNAADHHDARDADVRGCVDRCVVRNRWAREVRADDARRARAEVWREAQDPVVVGLPSGSSKKGREGEAKKKGRRRRRKALGDRSNHVEDVAARLSKLRVL